MNIKLVYVITICITAIVCSNAQTPQVISISPSFNEISSDMSPAISATFDMPMDSSSFNQISFSVLGERSGYHSGDINYNSSSRTVTFQSKEIYNSGERVTVSLSNHIKSMQGDSLTGFSWVFRIPAGVAPVYFSEPVEYSGGGIMQVVDINNDSYPDIAISSGVILINNGYGVFDQFWFIPDCDYFYPLVVDDFNRDGLMDIFYKKNDSDNLRIGIGDGKGNFKTTTKPLWFYEFFSTDLNRDGYPDIAGLSGVTYIPPDSTTLNWSIAFNDGAGNFIDTTMFRIGGGGRPEKIISTDIDNDGDLDVVIASHYEVNPSGIFGLNGIIPGKNDGFGNFDTFDLYVANDISYPYYIYASDFNNDYFDDIAVISSGGGVIELNSKNGDFSLDTTDTRYFWSAELAAPITGGDINGDGWVDMVTSGYEWPPENPIPYYTVKINNHSYFSRFDKGNFNDTLPDGYTHSTAIADINMDNRADIIHCSLYGTYITFNTDSVTDVKEQNKPVTSFDISNNYPNPFNSSTSFEIQVTEPQIISISIFNVLGKEVRELENKRFVTGEHKVNWGGKDNNRNSLPSGVYFIRVQAGKRIQYLKSILLK